MISINQIKNGMGLLVEGDLYTVLEYEHVKPGKGSAFVRVKLRNMKTGKVLDRTYRSSDKLEDVFIETRKLQYLYHSGHAFVFMDQESYDQISINEEIVGDSEKFIKENTEVTVSMHNNVPITVSPPVFVELEVTQAQPGLKGDTVGGSSKSVIVETGAEIQVPLFINQGDILKIDTRTGQYVERVSK